MFERGKIDSLEDFFAEPVARKGAYVYFYRVSGYNGAVGEFLRRYFEAASRLGAVIEGKLANPDGNQLAYYQEKLGTEFRLDVGFFAANLRNWLTGMDERLVSDMATATYDALDSLRRAGKNGNVLKNVYIKFMCWLYYKFGNLTWRLGQTPLPKLLCEGDISTYELLMLQILSRVGCDAVVLLCHGEEAYKKADPELALSDALSLPRLGAFPEGFGLKQLREERRERAERERLYGERPGIAACTNAWTEGRGLADVHSDPNARGGGFAAPNAREGESAAPDAGGGGAAPKLFYNCFLRINGVWDKAAYQNDLYQLWLGLHNAGRHAVVAEEGIPLPTVEEIAAVGRKNYGGQDAMLEDLSGKIRCRADGQLERLMRKAFLDILLEEAGQEGMGLNKLTNKAVSLLCWLRRYGAELFPEWRLPQVACFIYMGGVRKGNEALFLRLLARLPVDVLVLDPGREGGVPLADKWLYEMNYDGTLAVRGFPREESQVVIGTAAYHAERELDEVLYQDSGLYRDQQYQRASSVTLRTMYEEIAILWDQEVKYRPNFSTASGVVQIPVIFAKVSGVKDGDLAKYWEGIRALFTEETFLIKDAPFLSPSDENPMRAHAAEFLRNGKLQRAKIKAHRDYPYGLLREEVQEHILDKLQLLIDRRSIRGTFENGTEYTIVATVLNMRTEIVRLIQNFDFTKRNPKLVYINAGEKAISLEDSILAAFLNLVGFDVVFFVPTGYRSVEKHFNGELLEEHQLGGYVYDLRVPDFLPAPPGRGAKGRPRRSLRERLFGR